MFSFCSPISRAHNKALFPKEVVAFVGGSRDSKHFVHCARKFYQLPYSLAVSGYFAS